MARTNYAVLILAMLTAAGGCQMQRTRDEAPQSAAVQQPAAPPTPAAPGTFKPESAPPAAAKSASSPPSATPLSAQSTPAPASASKQSSGPPKTSPKTSSGAAGAEPKAATPTAPSPALTATKPAPLDLNSLEQRLKDTRAIGVFTKLSLKNQVDDLLGDFRSFHKGPSQTPTPVLRQKFDLLILKVLSLLQDGDPSLASAISSSREALWQILIDPNKFSKI